jgi:hypothetical protein
MKPIHSILPLLLILSILGCKPPIKIVCGITDQYEGEGLESKLIQCRLTGIMDTTAARIVTKVTYLQSVENEEKGVGVTVIIRKPGEKDHVNAGITNIDAKYLTYIQPGTYNIEFTYAGCNSLTLSNVELASGEIKEFKVQLGLQGKERKLFDVDLAQKR